MAADEEMGINERYKYLRTMQKRYRQADRKGKQQLLDEMEAVTQQHRKSLTRLMSSPLERQPRQRQRGCTYGPEVRHALRVIAESLDHVCAERLQPNLVWMAQHLAAHGEVVVSDETLDKLGQVSISTVQRLLAEQPRDLPRLPRKGPEQANRLARGIPAERIPWDEAEAGHFEVDLVHHCGVSASGHYVHTLQMIDVATGWSERVALLGRSYLVVRDGFKRILARLPFRVLEVHPDNGSEFLNDHLLRFWQDVARVERLSRSRAWQKNDNRFVEQKNDTLVRRYLGYDRLDTVEQTRLLNQLYALMGLYYNAFQPVMRLAEKIVLPAQNGRGTRIKRRFDQARTPFDRLCATGQIDQSQREQFESLRDHTNPRLLRQHIYALLDQLFALPNAPQGSTQDVYLTLFDPPDLTKGDNGHLASVTLSNERTIAPR
ncbi:MAG: transposase family protein [bacterium]|nr:transposase family protein [bacterium]